MINTIENLLQGFESSLNNYCYSKTWVKRPHKNRQNKDFMTNGSLLKVQSIAPLGAFCNTFDLHLTCIIR